MFELIAGKMKMNPKDRAFPMEMNPSYFSGR